ncbi:MAG: energy transducer TonB [Acidiphilium sp.]|nr:energy transducer TonB [Acidiphilium sp.]MDD4935458.1 energy transducer TonB [Acidiphilium sp.]
MIIRRPHLVILIALMVPGYAYGAMPPAQPSAPPVPHPIAPATLAAIAQEAQQMLAQPGVRYVGFYGFTVDHAGHVLSEWVVRSAGPASLDRMALAAIAKSVLKRLPKGAPPHMQFVVPFAFHRNGVVTNPPAAKPGG